MQILCEVIDMYMTEEKATQIYAECIKAQGFEEDLWNTDANKANAYRIDIAVLSGLTTFLDTLLEKIRKEDGGKA